MEQTRRQLCTAFIGTRLLAAGDLPSVALDVKAALEHGELTPVLIFDDVRGEVVDVDLRGSAEEIRQRLGCGQSVDLESESSHNEGAAPKGRGRPKLGVVAREVTLLPRHWEWLNSQPGGASVTIRKLVEEARRAGAAKDRVRHAQERAFRFMSAMAGNEEGFEEAARALFGANQKRFEDIVSGWPVDVGAYARRLAADAFGEL